MSPGRASGWLVAVLVGSVGCQPSLPDLQAEGQRVAVGVSAQVELCAGTLRAWDEHVGFVEAQLGMARDPRLPIEVYVVEDTEPWCDDVMACYIGGWVDATFVPTYEPRAIWHELVHHVVSGSDLGMTDRFLSEGIAGSLGDSWCPPPGTPWPRPALHQLLARPDVRYEHYPRAAQFAEFVRQDYGSAALVQLVDCVERGDPLSAVDACMHTALGDRLSVVDRRFAAAAPPLHENPALCRGPTTPWEQSHWTFEAALACEDPAVLNTFRSPHGRQTAALVEIAQPGPYAVSMQADGDASLEIEPCFCPTKGGSLVHDPVSSSLWVFEPGRYRLVFHTADPSTSRLRVDLRPLGEGEARSLG